MAQGGLGRGPHSLRGHAFPDGEPLSNVDIEWETTTGFFDEDTNKKRDFTTSDSSGYSYNKFYSEIAGSNSIILSIDGDSRDVNIDFIGPKILDLYYEYGVNGELTRYSKQIARCIGDDDGKLSISKTANIFALIGYGDGTLVGEGYPVKWKAIVDDSPENSVTNTNTESIATVSFNQEEDAIKTYSISASIPNSSEEESIDISLGENGARIILLETGQVNNLSLTKGHAFAYVKSCFDEKCQIGGGGHDLEEGKIYEYRITGKAHKFYSCSARTNTDCPDIPSQDMNNSPHLFTVAYSTDAPSNGKPYWTNDANNEEIVLIKGNNASEYKHCDVTSPGGGNGNSGGGNGNSGGGKGNGKNK